MKLLVTSFICMMVLAVTVSATAVFILPETIEGTVDNINENTLAVIQEQGTSHQIMEIYVDDQTEFKEIGSLTKLRKGDRVRIQYRKESGSRIAVSITLVNVHRHSLSSNRANASLYWL